MKRFDKWNKFWKKFWFVVWKDDSFKGWIISFIFLLVIIKGIFFPLMSLVTGSSLPLVIVESCSMYHDGNLFSNFDVWWEANQAKYLRDGISKEDFLSYGFDNGFNKGDILFVYGTDEDKLEVGDIIVFNANYRNPVVHRIIRISEQDGQRVFSTMGDNNNGQLPFEKKILKEQILGEVKANIAPYLGWGKLIFFEHLKPESERGFC